MAPKSKRGPGRSSKRTAAGSRPGGPRSASAKKGVPKPKKSAKFTTRAVVLMSVILLLLASYTSSLHAWWDQRSDIQSTKAEIVMRKQAIKSLQDDKIRWTDRAFVEQQARERFGWVLPGEVGYRVIGSDGKVQGNVPTLDAPTVPKTKQWYDKLWGTVVESGKEPKKAVVPPDPNTVLKK
ncbi:MAG: septum formation initiator family protein [Aeromicrobium sp.]